MPDHRPTVIVMAKEPRPGRVKTRLGRDIGTIPATWWFRHQLDGLLRRISDPRWAIVLAVAPDRAVHSGAFVPQLCRFPQGRGDLGQRMRRALETPALGPVLVIGADIPQLARPHIWQAFRVLARRDFVFGPAPDGGFWGVGAARRRGLPPELFQNARWSSPHALADSLASLNGQSHGLVQTLADVDTGADLARLRFRQDAQAPMC